jgi:hypothetical protein
LGASGRWVAIIRTEVTYLASFGASREKKMELAAYQRYLDHFNRRDYDGVVAHFCPDAEVRFAGVVLTGHQAIRDFYSFFHDYVIESISVTKFAASDELVALEANVRLEAKMDLSREQLEKAGYPSLVPLTAGDVFVMPQFIHYHMVDGKFASAACLVSA